MREGWGWAGGWGLGLGRGAGAVAYSAGSALADFQVGAPFPDKSVHKRGQAQLQCCCFLALPTFLSDSQGHDSDALLAVKSVDRLLGHVFADAWVRKTATGIHILLDVRPHCKCASQLVVSRWLRSRLDLVCKVWYCFLA